jgi:tetratricopeptide (TPR) repeat protein
MKIKALTIGTLVLAALLLLVWSSAGAQGAGASLEGQKTVIGPRNPFLSDGASALVSGDAERGVALTEKGLAIAQGAFEHKAALSNLCAGYLLVNKPQQALEACNQVLAEDPDFWRAYNNRALVYLELGRYAESEADIKRGQELRPKSKNLKLTRAKLLDATDPVVPTVEIDERRSAGEELDDGTQL